MRVSEVAGKVDLMRLNLLKKILDYVDISLRPLAFLDSSGLIERKIEEVGVGLVVESERTHRTLSLSTSDCSLEIEKSTRLRLTWLL